MKLTERFVSFLFGAFPSLLVGVSICSISQLPLRYLFAVLFGVLTFLVYLSIIKTWKWTYIFKHFSFSKYFKSDCLFSPDYFAALIYLLSIILVVIIPSDSTSQYIDWEYIPLLSYMRLFAGVLLCSILPGYALLRIIDRSKNLKGFSLLLFSFFLSLFVATVISFVLIIANSVDNVFSAILAINIILFVAYSVSTITSARRVVGVDENTERTYRLDYLIIACIFCFFIIGWVIYYSNYPLGSTGDMWTHYSTFLKISEGINLTSSPHLAYLDNEIWLPLHFVSIFYLTGFPAINGWMVYAFINFFYIIALYLACRGIVGNNHQKIPAIATVIGALFAGFGWIKALSLSSTNSSWLTALNTAGALTYNDITYTFLYGPIPQYFSLAVLFSLLYLMIRRDNCGLINNILTAILVALGLLVHAPEIILLPIFYGCYLLFVNPQEFNRLKKFSISILFGLLIVFLVGLAFSSHFYPNMQLAIFVLTSSTILSFGLIKFRQKFTFTYSSRKIPLIFICAVWFLFILSFFVWDSTLNLNITSNLSAIGLKPWYIYPVSSGVSLVLGLLGITSIIIWRNSKLENSNFLIFSFIALFITGVALSYFNVTFYQTGYWEKRFYTFMVLPLSILGAYFLTTIVTKLITGRFTKLLNGRSTSYALVGLLVALIMVSGVASSILALDRISLTSDTDVYANVSSSELAALDFLKTNTSSSATVVGLSTTSNRLVTVFSGNNHLNSVNWLTGNSSFQYIAIQSPELALKMLYSLNITYLYATNSDIASLSSSGYIASHLLDLLPVVYRNNEVIIYQVPKMNPPSSNSNVSLVIQSYMFDYLSNPKSIVDDLPQNVLVNDTFVADSAGMDWAVKNGTWTKTNGVYTGNESNWKISASMISGNVSDFSLTTDFKITSGYYAGVLFRSTDSQNYYAVLISKNGANDALYKVVDGKLIMISTTTGPSIGDGWNSLKVVAIGNEFSITLNGNLLLSASDKLYSSGGFGILVDSSISSFDNFLITQSPNIQTSVKSGFYYPIDMLAQSGLGYSIKTEADNSVFSSKYIILSSDVQFSNNLSTYLAWVNKGGQLIVLNGDGLGGYANLLSLRSSDSRITAIRGATPTSSVELGAFSIAGLYSTDSGVNVIAEYTSANNESVPLAFSKQIGQGELFYIDISSYSESVSSGQTNFENIGKLLAILKIDALAFEDITAENRWKYMLYDTTYLRNYISLEGSIAMESNSTIIPYTKFNVNKVEISNAVGTIGGSSAIQGILITDFSTEGEVSWTVNSDSLYLVPTNYGAYLASLINGNFNLTVAVTNGTLHFSILNDDNVQKVILTSGTVKLTNIRTSEATTFSKFNSSLSQMIPLENKTLLFHHTPSISIEGYVSCPEAYVPNYINYVNGYSLQINGTTSFDFDCSSNTVMMVTNFAYSGSFQSGLAAKSVLMSYWEFSAIPWISIIISPLFIVFCILFTMLFCVIIFRSKTSCSIDL